MRIILPKMLSVLLMLFATNVYAVDLLLNHKIPLSDGTMLSGNIYRPSNQEKALPVILTLTPYVSDENHDYGMYFAENGYVYVCVDTRGRGNSEGEFIVFDSEREDGTDIIDWLLKQSFCNGNVGMIGLEYEAYLIWQTGVKKHPALKSIISLSATVPGKTLPQRNNIFSDLALRWLTQFSDFGKNQNKAGWYMNSQQAEAKEEKVPFRNIDAYALGDSDPVYQEWLKHPGYDDYWKSKMPTKKELSKIDIPILSLTGYFDYFQRGPLQYYKDHGKKSAKHFLLIGPWHYDGWTTQDSILGGLNLGQSSQLNIKDVYKNWFDWTLKKGKRPKQIKNKVTYFSIGENKWKGKSSLKADKKRTFYFSSLNSNADNSTSPGELVKDKPKNEKPDLLSHSPLIDLNAEQKKNRRYNPNYYLDTSYMARVGDLHYLSDTLSSSLDLYGSIDVECFLQVNVPDADIRITFYEETQTGDRIRLGYALQRLRWQSEEKEQLLQPTKVYKYKLSSSFMARRLQKGSRVRAVIKAADNTFVQKNYQSNKDVSNQTKEDSRDGSFLIHHSNKYPSKLILNLLD